MKVDISKSFGQRECPSCACFVPANNNRCPICGYLFPVPTPRQRAFRLWGALLMLLVLFALLFLRWL